MQKYQFDWKMRLIVWFTRFGRSVAEGDLQKTRRRFDSKVFSNLVFRHVVLDQVDDRTIPGRQGTIPVRIYRPAKAAALPVIVYFHGGGFVLGGLDGHDSICRRLATENQAVIVSVNYRLAPEHKFPAAVEDAYDATCWVAEHAVELDVSPEKLVVMGDSAGGNLAAVVSLMARDLSGPRIAFQVLIYPVVDFGENSPSKQFYQDAPILDRKVMESFRDMYLNQLTDAIDPRVSPLLAKDLIGLPPALILTAEYDPLRDEGKAYADRLRDAGINVIYACYPGMIHGFVSFGRLGSATKPAFDQIKQSLRSFSVDKLNGH